MPHCTVRTETRFANVHHSVCVRVAIWHFTTITWFFYCASSFAFQRSWLQLVRDSSILPQSISAVTYLPLSLQWIPNIFDLPDLVTRRTTWWNRIVFSSIAFWSQSGGHTVSQPLLFSLINEMDCVKHDCNIIKWLTFWGDFTVFIESLVYLVWTYINQNLCFNQNSLAEGKVGKPWEILELYMVFRYLNFWWYG